MNFLPDRRGVSEVLGAILVFALVMAVLVIVQVAGVPAANQQIEFEHNARVQADFQEFDQGVDRAAALGAESSSSVETGVRYPPRLFLINPGPAAGTISTAGPSSVEFRNVESVNAETNDYFSGTVPYTTTSLSYRPSYNEYGSAPMTTYEHGVLYNSDENGAAVFAGGNLVSGNRISLTMLDGSISDSSTKAVTLQAVPISAPAQTVSVQGASGNELELAVYTSLSEDDWRERILADELTPSGHVTDIECQSGAADDEPCNGEIVVSLESGVTYDIRLSKVGVGSGYSEEGPAYLSKVGADTPAIQPGGTDLTVELRDRFNNPVAGETVSFEIVTGNATFVGTTPTKTDEAGRATITVDPIDNTSMDIRAWYDPDADNVLDSSENTDAYVVEYNALPVADNAMPPTGDLKDINPRGTVQLVDAQVSKSNGKLKVLTIELENADDTAWTLEKTRVSFVIASESPTQVLELTRTDRNPDVDMISAPIDLGGELKPISNGKIGADGSGDDTATLEFEFDQAISQSNTGKPFDTMVIITFEATNDAGETTYLTYFV